MSTLTAVTAVIVNLLAIVAGLYAAYRWLRSWLRRQIEETRIRTKVDESNFKDELSTEMSNHMTTIGRRFNTIEQKLDSLYGIYVRVGEMDEWATVADKRIMHANDVALIALRRVDDLLERDK